MAELRATHRHHETCCRPSPPAGRPWWRAFARAAERAGYGHDPHAPVRGPRRLPAGGRVDRRRPQGDVRLRGQGRPPHRAAPRDDRLGRSGPSSSTGPTVPWKTWYVGPNFRYESPQAGRYRQFYQVDLEAIGSADPDLDVEVIALGWRLLRRPRAASGRAVAQLARRRHLPARPTGRSCSGYLDAAPVGAVRRAQGPPRRQPAAGPRLQEARVPGGHRRTRPASSTTSAIACSAHFDRVKAGLEALGVPYRIDTRLVRGLDYYTRTTFEYAGRWRWSRPRTLSAAGAATTAWSRRWAARPRRPSALPSGVERILLACDAEGVLPATTPSCRSTSSSSTSPAATAARDLTVAAAGRRAAGRPGLRRPLAQGPVQGGRPLRGPPGPGGRPRRGGGRPGRSQGPAAATARRPSSPGPMWWARSGPCWPWTTDRRRPPRPGCSGRRRRSQTGRAPGQHVARSGGAPRRRLAGAHPYRAPAQGGDRVGPGARRARLAAERH